MLPSLISTSYYGHDALCTAYISPITEEETSTQNFGIDVLIRKEVDDDEQGVKTEWNIRHNIAVLEDASEYAIHTNLFLNARSSSMAIDLHAAREARVPMSSLPKDGHVLNAGRIVEQVEGKLRSALCDFYGKRIGDFCQDIRYLTGGPLEATQRSLASELCAKMQ